jgi:hypothetical protein
MLESHPDLGSPRDAQRSDGAVRSFSGRNLDRFGGEMIEPIPGLPDNVIGFEAAGEVTKDDYVQRLVPAVNTALEKHDKVRLLYVLGSGFTGYSGSAMWEDTKLGVEHVTKWERVAVVSDHAWIRQAVNVLGYLIPGEVKAFELGERSDATAWVSS